ncbi:hypothetical protein [Terriglobus sp. RCC_193]|uniref:hypothetical protein n=1 Tax=Terriglobus sp. RCC_193 TaxID=3239218 RepID=UPI003524598B
MEFRWKHFVVGVFALTKLVCRFFLFGSKGNIPFLWFERISSLCSKGKGFVVWEAAQKKKVRFSLGAAPEDYNVLDIYLGAGADENASGSDDDIKAEAWAAVLSIFYVHHAHCGFAPCVNRHASAVS